MTEEKKAPAHAIARVMQLFARARFQFANLFACCVGQVVQDLLHVIDHGAQVQPQTIGI